MAEKEKTFLNYKVLLTSVKKSLLDNKEACKVEGLGLGKAYYKEKSQTRSYDREEGYSRLFIYITVLFPRHIRGLEKNLGVLRLILMACSLVNFIKV